MTKRSSAIAIGVFGALALVGVLVYWIVRDPSTAPRPVDLGGAAGGGNAAQAPRPAPPESRRIDPMTASTPPITSTRFVDPDERAQEIAGLVQTEAAVPIEGAVCELFENSSPMKQGLQEGEFRTKAVTNDMGLFAFDRTMLSIAERYVLKVSHPVYATEYRGIDLKTPEGGYLKVTMVPGTSITGTVKSEGDAVLSNASIVVYEMGHGALDPNGSIEATGTSDERGSYTIANLNAGTKKVTASVIGLATAVRQGVRVESGRPVSGIDFVLGQGASISGRIIDQASGSAIPDAWVTARTAGPPQRAKTPSEKEQDARVEKKAPPDGAAEESAKVQKDSQDGRESPKRPTAPAGAAANTIFGVRSKPDGAYLINGLEAGRPYVLSVNIPGWAAPAQLTVSAPSSGIDFTLAPTPRVLGRVVDDETGRPIPMFTVALSNIPDATILLAHAKKAFGPPKFTDGRFEYLDVPVGNFWLVAEARGYAGGRSSELVLAAGERREGVEIRIGRGATLKGRVVDSKGSPIANATVEADSAAVSNDPKVRFFDIVKGSMRQDLKEAKTGDDGSFTLPHLLGGSYALNVRHPEFAPHTTPPVMVPASGETSMGDIVIPRGGAIRGRIRLPDGRPDPKAAVQVNAAAGTTATPRMAETDSEGRFEVNGLAAGSYRVAVVKRNGENNLGALFGQGGTVHALAEGETKDLPDQ